MIPSYIYIMYPWSVWGYVWVVCNVVRHKEAGVVNQTGEAEEGTWSTGVPRGRRVEECVAPAQEVLRPFMPVWLSRPFIYTVLSTELKRWYMAEKNVQSIIPMFISRVYITLTHITNPEDLANTTRVFRESGLNKSRSSEAGAATRMAPAGAQHEQHAANGAR